MIMKPTPTTYFCPACGWKKTVAPISDVRLRGVDSFDRCPKCGSENLDARRASSLPGLTAQVMQHLSRPGK